MYSKRLILLAQKRKKNTVRVASLTSLEQFCVLFYCSEIRYCVYVFPRGIPLFSLALQENCVFFIPLAGTLVLVLQGSHACEKCKAHMHVTSTCVLASCSCNLLSTNQ